MIYRLSVTLILISFVWSAPARAGELTSIFGVDLGKSLPQNTAIRGKASIRDALKILDAHDLKEFSIILDEKIGTLLVPPEPNRHYTIYLAIITPKTRRVGAIWARGPISDDCAMVNKLLAQHFINKYDDMEYTSLTSLDSMRKGIIWLRSPRVELSFSCGALEAIDTATEKEFEVELEQMLTERLSKELQIDTGGL